MLKTKDLLVPLRVAEANDCFELASRLKQRITDIMGYAVQCGLIDRNPAKDMAGALMPPLDYYYGCRLTKLAIQFTLLTFSRSSESALPTGLNSTQNVPCGRFRRSAHQSPV